MVIPSQASRSSHRVCVTGIEKREEGEEGVESCGGIDGEGIREFGTGRFPEEGAEVGEGGRGGCRESVDGWACGAGVGDIGVDENAP
jgi:hypothetical protein